MNGIPEVYVPGCVIDFVMNEYPEIVTLSQIEMWPTKPAPPPTMQCRPMVTLPEIPTQPAMTECAPILTLWATWIRLSSFTPSSITVSSRAPRSMAQFAPISTSSPMRTAPTCGILSQRPSEGAMPKPSEPITTPECTMPRSPTEQSA